MKLNKQMNKAARATLCFIYRIDRRVLPSHLISWDRDARVFLPLQKVFFFFSADSSFPFFSYIEISQELNFFYLCV